MFIEICVYQSICVCMWASAHVCVCVCVRVCKFDGILSKIIAYLFWENTSKEIVKTRYMVRVIYSC